MPGDGFRVDPAVIRLAGQHTQAEAGHLQERCSSSLDTMGAAAPGMRAGGIDEFAMLADQQEWARQVTTQRVSEAVTGVNVLGQGAQIAADNYEATDATVAQGLTGPGGDAGAVVVGPAPADTPPPRNIPEGNAVPVTPEESLPPGTWRLLPEG